MSDALLHLGRLTDRQLVGWTGPYPTLSRKRPTADLVSRKVLTPLLGQIVMVVLAQLAIFQTVQTQPWYVVSFVELRAEDIANCCKQVSSPTTESREE